MSEILTPLNFALLNALGDGKSSIELMAILENKGFEQDKSTFYQLILRMKRKSYLWIEKRHQDNIYHINLEGKVAIERTKRFYR